MILKNGNWTAGEAGGWGREKHRFSEKSLVEVILFPCPPATCLFGPSPFMWVKLSGVCQQARFFQHLRDKSLMTAVPAGQLASLVDTHMFNSQWIGRRWKLNSSTKLPLILKVNQYRLYAGSWDAFFVVPVKCYYSKSTLEEM